MPLNSQGKEGRFLRSGISEKGRKGNFTEPVLQIEIRRATDVGATDNIIELNLQQIEKLIHDLSYMRDNLKDREKDKKDVKSMGTSRE